MFDHQQLEEFKKNIISLCNAENFDSEKDAMDYIEKSVAILENEITSYRPADDLNNCGGLLDFSSSLLPVVVVPDLHGRFDFLVNLLFSDVTKKYVPECPTVLDALNQNKIIVICVGDGVHGEARVFERWIESYNDFIAGDYTGLSMQQEMKENIATMKIVMLLKNSFTENFHFLKGNHENILNKTGDGNYSFRKFCDEGAMCKKFVQEKFGETVLYLIDCFEKSLPICAVFKNFAVSHAEPARVFKKDAVINYHEFPNVIECLTWTANNEVEEITVPKFFKALNPSCKKNENIIWFGGHRPVKQNYALRQDGFYIQIHNPEKQNVAVAIPGKKFNPDEQIVSVKQ